MRVPAAQALELARVGLATTAGTGLGLLFAVAALARRAKPLHPVGTVAPGQLAVTPAVARSGCPLLDEPGSYSCLVRASDAIGIGPEHPDIEGFALRLEPESADANLTDVLFASTGTGPVGRHLLALRTAEEHGIQTTLLPVRAGARALLLRLDPSEPRASQPWPTRYQLSWAHGRGPWQRFGELTVEWNGHRDAPVRFDPVVNGLPGTSQYRPLLWLREPAYRLSRICQPSAGHLAKPGR